MIRVAGRVVFHQISVQSFRFQGESPELIQKRFLHLINSVIQKDNEIQVVWVFLLGDKTPIHPNRKMAAYPAFEFFQIAQKVDEQPPPGMRLHERLYETRLQFFQIAWNGLVRRKMAVAVEGKRHRANLLAKIVSF